MAVTPRRYGRAGEHLHTITVGDDDAYEATVAALSHFPYEPMGEADPKAFR